MISIRTTRIFVLVALAMIVGPAAQEILLSQDQPHRATIAVLRFKSLRETPERRNIVKDLSEDLAAALRENIQLALPEDAAVKEAIADEGLKPDGLLELGECFDVGEALKVDYVVAGSALLKGVKWHASVRVLAVRTKSLVATADVEYSVDEMNSLFGVLAARIGAAVAGTPKEYVGKSDFTWKGEYLLSFGKHRIDIEPPILVAINSDPPFEVSIIAEMAVARGGSAVTNFEVYIDDLGLGSIYADLTPPRFIKEREWKIGGTTYVFSLDLKEMKVFTETVEAEQAKYVTSARFLVTARPLEEGK